MLALEVSTTMTHIYTRVHPEYIVCAASVGQTRFLRGGKLLFVAIGASDIQANSPRNAAARTAGV